jgi:hypothetical protein
MDDGDGVHGEVCRLGARRSVADRREEAWLVRRIFTDSHIGDIPSNLFFGIQYISIPEKGKKRAAFATK